MDETVLNDMIKKDKYCMVSLRACTYCVVRLAVSKSKAAKSKESYLC